MSRRAVAWRKLCPFDSQPFAASLNDLREALYWARHLSTDLCVAAHKREFYAAEVVRLEAAIAKQERTR